MKEVTLGSTEFKALSSDNRVKILKMLNERKYTLTEIAKKLELTSPSSKQHLDILLKSNLVELIDEGRKWKYYALTRKGKDLIDAEQRQTTVLLLLSITGIMFFGLMFLYTNPNLISAANAGQSYVQPAPVLENVADTQQGATIVGEEANKADATIQSTAPSAETTGEIPPEKQDTTPVAIALIVVAGIMILLVLQYGKIRKIIGE